MKVTVFLVAILMILPAMSEAISYQDYLVYKKKKLEETELHKEKIKQGYASYKESYRKALDEYKKEINEKWGYADFSTGHRYVVYSDDKEQKLIVDYENETISYSSVGEIDSSISSEFIENSLENSVGSSGIKLIDSLGFNDVESHAYANNIIENSVEKTLKEALSDNVKSLVDVEEKIKMAALSQHYGNEEIDESDKKYLESIQKEISNIEKSIDEIDRNSLLSKNTKIRKIAIKSSRLNRAMKFQEVVAQQSRETGIEEALIYAIIEAESSFNPMAVSPVPAFGMMQIVPSTAGVDVNYALYKTRVAPEEDFLFDPDNNIKFGSFYLKILNDNYFRGVKDKESRLYCIVAGYNTGMGNVASAFNDAKEKSVGKALPQINSMPPMQVKLHLLKNLPYEETKKYLEKVVSNYDFYSKNFSG